jgi:hypothetical protein
MVGVKVLVGVFVGVFVGVLLGAKVKEGVTVTIVGVAVGTV